MRNLLAFSLLFLSLSALRAQHSLQFTLTDSLPQGITGMAYGTDGQAIYSFFGAPWQKTGIYRLDPRKGKWETLRDDLPGRWRPNFHFVNGTWICLNGMDAYTPECEDRLVTSVEVFDPESRSFTHLTDNPNPVYGAGSALWEGKIYVVGGRRDWRSQDESGWSSALWRFDPVDKSWTRLVDMPEAKECEAAIVDGILYVIGGQNKVQSNRVDAYNIAQNRWMTLGFLGENLGEFALTQHEGSLYLVGSHQNPNSLYRFDPQRMDLQPLESNLSAHRNGAAVVMNGNLYAFGGTARKPCEYLAEGQVAPLGEQKPPVFLVQNPDFDLESAPNSSELKLIANISGDFSLSNLRGELIFRTEVNGDEPIRLPNLSNGKYIASLKNAQNGEVRKVVSL
ncbi:MAG: hypothetical protein H6581_12635 [Bacteroidia bacterium]|nr:hypothetical protein [Bacteroidia bacterium]